MMIRRFTMYPLHRGSDALSTASPITNPIVSLGRHITNNKDVYLCWSFSALKIVQFSLYLEGSFMSFFSPAWLFRIVQPN